MPPTLIDPSANISESEVVDEPNTSSELDAANVECQACLESCHAGERLHVACGCCYCASCVVRFFEAAITDTSAGLPRCCNKAALDVSRARQFMTSEMAARVDLKIGELNDTNRIYCANGSCARYLPRTNLKNGAVYCGQCKHSTCVLCRLPDHKGACIKATDAQGYEQLEELADFGRWVSHNRNRLCLKASRRYC